MEPTRKNVATAYHLPTTDEMRAAYLKEWGYVDAGIDQWVINGPYHPAWSWWYVAAVHLRPVEGAPLPKKQFPDAEYELSIWSLKDAPNLDDLAQGRITEQGRLTWLWPPDFVQQFSGATDDEVRDIVSSVVQLIVDGQSCDSDYRYWWAETLAALLAELPPR